VNDAGQTNPTYEFFPPAPGAKPIASPLLQRTLPANLFPLLWVLPSARLFVQANFGTAILDWKKQQEFQLPDMPHAVRTYPASGGNVMLPLTPANNWTATILFCSGMDVAPTAWDPNADWPTTTPSKSCVRITPDVSENYEEDDDVPVGRSMGNMILLPTGKILYLNGAQNGVAGYGSGSNTIGDSYADNPAFQPMMYDPDAPAGQRWSQDGLSPSTIPRMYHSSATLLPDGTCNNVSIAFDTDFLQTASLMVAGSSPHPDVVLTNTKFPTEYRVEYFFPSYFNERRPEPKGIPASLGYGGAFFNITLSTADLGNNMQNLQGATAVIIRTGFSTHGLSMSQQMLVLENSVTGNADGSGMMHVSQVPPNPAVFPPGPALFFVVVDGVPSIGVQVMIGTGQIGTQPVKEVTPLPKSHINAVAKAANNADAMPSGSVSASAAPSVPTVSQVTVQAANSAVALSSSLSGFWFGALAPAVLAGMMVVLSL
jgi:hypothetical protein